MINIDFNPMETNDTLWRYMDFAKFVALLESQELFFTRADKFEDKYEGMLSLADKESLYRRFLNTKSREEISSLIDSHRQNGKNYFVNCWYANNDESAAMWKLYSGRDGFGVAIKSCRDRLEGVLDRNGLSIMLSKVRYIDYQQQETLGTVNVIETILCKRKSFSHEQEVRAVTAKFIQDPLTNFPDNVDQGVGVAIDVGALVEAVYVSPEAPDWFAQLVEKVIKKYGLCFDVIHSRLYDYSALA